MNFFDDRWLFRLAGGGVLFVLGFAAGRISPASPPPNAVRSASIPALEKSRNAVSPIVRIGKIDSAAPPDWEAAWAKLSALPPSPATDKTTAAALEKLAGVDPARALAIALSERQRQRRTTWLHAVLRGWAASQPDAAAAWIATLPAADHEGAEAAVMDGAARNPGAAITLAQKLVASDPAAARSHASQLLRAFSEAGDYAAAVDFATRLPEQIRSEMLGDAFQYWGLSQPERALDVAMNLPAGDQRKAALDAAISGWSQGDPAGLAEFALSIPSAEDRAEALQTALREWTRVNVKEASDWIDRFDPKPELDAGAAAVALQPELLAGRPAIAASWAESITQPQLRSSTLLAVLQQWAARDSGAALAYARNSTALLPDDRTALLNPSAAPVLGP